MLIMKKLILALMLFMGLTCHAETKNSDIEKILVNSYFEKPIDKSQVASLDQQIILSNFAVSATGYFYHRCSKISSDYADKVQFVKYNLLAIFPTIQSDLAQTHQWQDNFEKLDKKALATLEVITAVNRLDENFINEPLIEKSLCDGFINNYGGSTAKQAWLHYYQQALPVLIDEFNQVYIK